MGFEVLVRKGDKADGLGDRRPKLSFLRLSLLPENPKMPCLGEFCPDGMGSASFINSLPRRLSKDFPRRLSKDWREDPPSKASAVGLGAWIFVVVSLTLSLNFVDSLDTMRTFRFSGVLFSLRQACNFAKASCVRLKNEK